MTPPRLTSPYSADLALRASGLLAAFNTAGVLAPADVHVAARLGALLGEADERVLLAVALTVRATRTGSVVTDLRDVAVTTTADPDDGDPDVAAAAGLPWPDVEAWVAGCSASPLTTGAAAPVRQRGSRLWLARYDAQEQHVADELRVRTADLPGDLRLDVLLAGLDRLFPDPGDADQRIAAAICALSRVSVLAGGPGTGKTTTVSRLLALLKEQHPRWRVALAAPTGKAAARLDEAVARSSAALPDRADRERLGRLEGVTLHRLLGWRPGSRSRFRHDRTNRLPFEVVVVDEASMVPLTMMARLLDALRPATRLVLVGDPDQLASVEAGAVLGDLVDRTVAGARTPAMAAALDAVAPGTAAVEATAPGTAAVQATPPETAAVDGVATGTAASNAVAPTPAARIRDGIASLTVNHRFDASSAIGLLAAAVRDGNVDAAVAALRSGRSGVELVEVADDAAIEATALTGVATDVVAWGGAMRRAALAGDHEAALLALDTHRLLCAHRRGPRGVQHWEDLVRRWLAAADPGVPVARADGHYGGEPLLVTTNDYDVGLFNGDTGVVVAGAALAAGPGVVGGADVGAGGADVGAGGADVGAGGADGPGGVGADGAELRAVGADEPGGAELGAGGADVGAGGADGPGGVGVGPGVLRAWFARGVGSVSVPLVRLGAVRPVYAMTVHRSQGSQFDRVTVVLPTADSPLATRETVYTALTRAVRHVRVIGSVDAFAAAVARPAARATGLRERLGR